MTTGQCACAAQWWPTDPSSIPFSPPRPREPTTRRSACAERFTSTPAGLPVTIFVTKRTPLSGGIPIETSTPGSRSLRDCRPSSSVRSAQLFVGSLEAESAPGTRGSDGLVARQRLALLDLGEAVNGLQQFGRFLLGLVLVARGEGAGDAVVDVLVENLEGEAVQCG